VQFLRVHPLGIGYSLLHSSTFLAARQSRCQSGQRMDSRAKTLMTANINECRVAVKN